MAAVSTRRIRGPSETLPAGGDGGGDFGVGEAAFGADGDLGGERFAQIDLLKVIGRWDGRRGGGAGGSLALDPSHPDMANRSRLAARRFASGGCGRIVWRLR